jgi:hypothetical protein
MLDVGSVKGGSRNGNIFISSIVACEGRGILHESVTVHRHLLQTPTELLFKWMYAR